MDARASRADGEAFRAMFDGRRRRRRASACARPPACSAPRGRLAPPRSYGRLVAT